MKESLSKRLTVKVKSPSRETYVWRVNMGLRAEKKSLTVRLIGKIGGKFRADGHSESKNVRH